MHFIFANSGQTGGRPLCLVFGAFLTATVSVGFCGNRQTIVGLVSIWGLSMHISKVRTDRGLTGHCTCFGDLAHCVNGFLWKLNNDCVMCVNALCGNKQTTVTFVCGPLCFWGRGRETRENPIFLWGAWTNRPH